MPDKIVPPKGKPFTLTDADISSKPNVSRRAMLGTLGIGAGVAAAALLGAVTPAEAQRRCRDTDPDDPCSYRRRYSDPHDSGRWQD